PRLACMGCRRDPGGPSPVVLPEGASRGGSGSCEGIAPSPGSRPRGCRKLIMRPIKRVNGLPLCCEGPVPTVGVSQGGACDGCRRDTGRDDQRRRSITTQLVVHHLEHHGGADSDR